MAGSPARSNYEIFTECFWHHVCLSHELPRDQEVRKGDAQGVFCGVSHGGHLAARKSPEGEVLQQRSQALLDDFTTRLFMALPPDLRTISVQKGPSFPEHHSKPYSISRLMLVCSNITDDLDENTKNYLGIAKGVNIKRLYMPILCDYVKAASQNHGSCEICQRDRFKLTKHHLIPRVMHGKLLKQGSCGKHQLNQIAWLCRGCHEFIHHRIKPHVLAEQYPSVNLLLTRRDVKEWAKKFRKIVRKVGWFGSSRCNILLGSQKQLLSSMQWTLPAKD